MPADIRYVQVRLSPEEKARLDEARLKGSYPTLQDFIEELIDEGIRSRQSNDERELSLNDTSPVERRALLDYLELMRDPDPTSHLQGCLPGIVREVMEVRRKHLKK